jgi:hypothetical protein
VLTPCLFLAATLMAGAAGAVPPGEAPHPALALHVFTLQHQPAGEALPLIVPLLSQQGTVELKQVENQLVIRDSLAALSRIVPVLRSFDHPSRRLEVAIWLVSAGKPGFVPAGEPTPPAELIERLRESSPYQHFHLEGQSRLESREGEEVTVELPRGYVVAFKLGTILADERIKLHGLELRRRGEDETEAQVLLRTNLNLFVDRTFALGLAAERSADSALMIVIHCRPLASDG